ncbi:MAG TPA: DUF507 family protein [Myxococcota bacterium]|nr:DUF507 family protein [Myxococcota bacterium]
MKIYTKTIPIIAKEIVDSLVGNGDIELEEGLEAEAPRDFEAILAEYVRSEREVCDYTTDVLASHGWGNAKYGEARRLAAANRKVPLDDEALDFIINQMLEFMLMSANIAEVYAEDRIMRKRIADIIRRSLKVHDELDVEVRKRLRNLQEGTRDWEIAYRKTMEEVRRAKGLV